MPRLTKSEIETSLLSGKSIDWKEGGKVKQISLVSPAQRRLFSFILNQNVRDPKGLPEEFIVGLKEAYIALDDPALELKNIPQAASKLTGWRLYSIKTEGFGGLNTWNGPPFEFVFNGDSFLIEGPNGSGKSSLVGAILWALTGERPRDQTDNLPHQDRPVYGSDEKVIGNWPPIACYPPKIEDLIQQPYVSIILSFIDRNGTISTIERTLKNGEITYRNDDNFNVPSIFFETGLLMPTRLSTMRFDDRNGRLTDAVQKLTGLDDLIHIGNLVSGLCHGSREYLSPLRKERDSANRDFQQVIKNAREELAVVSVDVPHFEAKETENSEGDLARLGKQVSEQAVSLTSVIVDDLKQGLNLRDHLVLTKIVAAIETGRSELSRGLTLSPAWNKMRAISSQLTEVVRLEVLSALQNARERVKEALDLDKLSSADSKFQLKAVASIWHLNHKTGPIEQCPLCDERLTHKPDLAREMENLQNSGPASSRTFRDNINNIIDELNSKVPDFLRRQDIHDINVDPRESLVNDLKQCFVAKNIYSEVLSRLADLMGDALLSAPLSKVKSYEFVAHDEGVRKVYDKIDIIERSLFAADWYKENHREWEQWWYVIYPEKISGEAISGIGINSPICETLSRVSEALLKAEPYRKAAELMRQAWVKGKTVVSIDENLNLREAIVENLDPLKMLSSLAESVASDAIAGLSGRVELMLKETLLTEKLGFQKARMNRKEGLVVQGRISDSIHIDATLVANSAWLRAVLWALIFALREEAVDQLGTDPFRLMVFDDPQSTFDGIHRNRWAQYINSLQKEDGSNMQIVLVTHDENFLELVKISGITGREVMLLGASAQLGHIMIFEGALLERKWDELKKAPSPDWKEYVAKVRVHVEGLLRIMLRAEGTDFSHPLKGLVIGKAREKIKQLNEAEIAPWNRVEFRRLINELDHSRSSVKYLEMSHHSPSIGPSEAHEVEKYWKNNIYPALIKAFKLAREYYYLHGRLTALHEPPTHLVLPNGYGPKIKSIHFTILGRAAALTNGRIADGCIDFEEFGSEESRRVVFDKHVVYKLAAATLEPVARRGDVLLVKTDEVPLPKSLVVALCDSRMLARRYEVADNHTDIAVLTAHSVNPHHIAPPVVAHRATVKMHQVAGVLYNRQNVNMSDLDGAEFCECGGELVISQLVKEAVGLVQVSGHSAVPYALDGQYLIIGKSITDYCDIERMVGLPVIAADSENRRYFKRLQIPAEDRIVLESLDSGGDYEPILLNAPGGKDNCLNKIWPVLGVLFDR